MSCKILIIPADITGILVAQGLKQKGLDFSVAPANPDEAEQYKNLDAQVIKFDYADAEGMVSAMQGFDVVYMETPLCEEMIAWGSHAVAAAAQAGVKHVVRLSMLGADRDAHFRLGRLHGAIDQGLVDGEMDYTLIRPNSYMQDYSTLYADMIKSGQLILAESDSRTSLIDARDVADSVVGVLSDSEEHKGMSYAVTGPEALDNFEIAKEISRVSGREVEYKPVDGETCGFELEKIGLPEWNIRMLLTLSDQKQKGYTALVTKAVKHLAERPARPFADFVRENAGAWK